MADQNVNIQIFDQQGNAIGQVGDTWPEPTPGNTHTPPPGYNPADDAPTRRERAGTEAPEESPLSSILEMIGSAVSPASDMLLGRPITNAIGKTYQAGKAIYDTYNVAPTATTAPSPPGGPTPPSPGSPPGTPPGPGPVPPNPVTVPPVPPGGGPGGPPVPPVPPGGPPVPPVPPVGPGAGILLGLSELVIPLAAVAAAATAATVAFLYAKDQMLSAAAEVARFAPGTAQATAESRVSDVMNKVDRAQLLESQFTEMINLQTEANKLWSEVGNEVMRVIGPTVIEMMKGMNVIIAALYPLVKILEVIIYINDLLSYILPNAIKQLEAIYDWMKWFGWKSDDEKKKLAIMAAADAMLNPLLGDVKAGNLPKNKGLGG